MACRTYTVRTPKRRTVTRCDDRKLAVSASERYAKHPPCRAAGRFARCDTEHHEPAAVRRAAARAERAAAASQRAAERSLTGQLCYRTKAAMVKALKEANLHVTQVCQRDPTGAEFDAINHRYDRRGARKATSCDDAIRIASPTRPPYCLDRVDFDALNALDVAEQNGGFRLPPKAQAALTELEARRRVDEDPVDPWGPRPYELEGLRRKRRR